MSKSKGGRPKPVRHNRVADKTKAQEQSASEARRHRNYRGADDRALPQPSATRNKQVNK